MRAGRSRPLRSCLAVLWASPPKSGSCGTSSARERRAAAALSSIRTTPDHRQLTRTTPDHRQPSLTLNSVMPSRSNWHPRISAVQQSKIVDGRDKPGHDGFLSVLEPSVMVAPRIKRALLSVSDKTGLVDFAKGLAGYGVEIGSTGGTAKLLRGAGLNDPDVAESTRSPERMHGRGR